MTPKEKAKELLDKISKLDHRAWYDVAKKCALIAVNEIYITLQNERVFESLEYWQEVKQEIEKL